MVASEPLSPILAHAFPPRCPSPVTLLLAPSSHTVQPSILDRVRVRDLPPPRLAWPCWVISRQGYWAMGTGGRRHNRATEEASGQAGRWNFNQRESKNSIRYVRESIRRDMRIKGIMTGQGTKGSKGALLPFTDISHCGACCAALHTTPRCRCCNCC
jgi:hypothetical protein